MEHILFARGYGRGYGIAWILFEENIFLKIWYIVDTNMSQYSLESSFEGTDNNERILPHN